jgi:hypothetical protein
MDSDLSKEIRNFLFSNTYINDEYYKSFIDPLGLLLPIIDEYDNEIHIEFKKFVNDGVNLISVKNKNKLTININQLINKIRSAYFVDSDNKFYQVKSIKMENVILKIELEEIDNTEYFDLIPSEVLATIMLYLDNTSANNVCKIKKNFCTRSLWENILLIGYPKYGKDILDEYKVLELYGYRLLVEALNKFSNFESKITEEIHPADLVLSNYITSYLISKIKTKYQFPHYFTLIKNDKEFEYLKYSRLNKVNLQYGDDNVYVRYLKTGLLPDDFTFSQKFDPKEHFHEIYYNIFSVLYTPELLYDLISNPNFKYNKVDYVYQITDVLFYLIPNRKLFANHVNFLRKEYPEALDTILRVNPYPNKYSDETYLNLVNSIQNS